MSEKKSFDSEITAARLAGPVKVRWLTKPPYNEKGKCRWCLAPVPAGRLSWCSKDCVDAYLIRSSSQHVRRLVFQRDRGICAICGTDCRALEKYLRQLHYLRKLVRQCLRPNSATVKEAKESIIQIEQELSSRDFPIKGVRKSLWDADHILEVSEGGGLCGLENFQTLCIPCHTRKTTRKHREQAQQRRVDRTGQLEML